MCKILRLCCLIIVSLPLCCLTVDADTGKCPLVRVNIERLPDLNIARGGHMVCCLDGELTVIGGHTEGFVPTSTAEYLHNGKWIVVPTVYPHDNGVGVVLNTGKVMIAGGHEKNLGVGQSFAAEMYDPRSHTFTGFGCLDTKRSMANGIWSDGHVVIAGNWYAGDDIEVFDCKKYFSHAHSVTVQRAHPYLFDTYNGNVMVVGGMTTRGQYVPTSVVDRLKSDTLVVDLFKTWQPTGYCMHQSQESYVEGFGKGFMNYLMPVKNAEGQMAIVLVSDTTFSLLPTNYEIPMKGPWGAINYYSHVIVDNQSEKGYVAGCGVDNRLYALCIEYKKRPAALTLYHTDVLDDSCTQVPVLTPGGNLAFVGGTLTDNFVPFKAAYVLQVGSEESLSGSALSPFFLGVIVLLVVFVIMGFLYRWRKCSCLSSAGGAVTVSEEPQNASLQLMNSIDEIVLGKKRYLKTNLKVTDIAHELRVHRNTISECINTQKGCTFAQYVNGYRIEHAKRIMAANPNIKMQKVFLESGYGNDVSFFRTFKAFTGMTPKEWIARNT